MTVNEASDKELICNLIDNLANLQRIQLAENKDAEIENQINIIKVKLKNFGVMINDIQLHK
jgi:hypothetical protein